jgi:RNA polymerase sigma-B factor
MCWRASQGVVGDSRQPPLTFDSHSVERFGGVTCFSEELVAVIPVEPRREERALFDRLARDHDTATRDVLVDRFLPLARQLARRYRGVEDIDDLEQVAAIGLMKAIDRFEADRGLAFSTFAFPTILGELKRHLRDRSWSVHVPRAVQELAMRVERLTGEMASELGRSATVAELAERSGTNIERVVEALQAVTARRALSLDLPTPLADDPDSGRDVAVEESGFTEAEDAATLEELLRRLPQRDRVILALRFREDRYQWQIAEQTGVSQVQVSRVIRRAIEQLQSIAETRPRPLAGL